LIGFGRYDVGCREIESAMSCQNSIVCKSPAC